MSHFRFDCHWRSISPRATGKEGAYLFGIEYDWIRQSINRNTHSVDRHASHRIKRERKQKQRMTNLCLLVIISIFNVMRFCPTRCVFYGWIFLIRSILGNPFRAGIYIQFRKLLFVFMRRFNRTCLNQTCGFLVLFLLYIIFCQVFRIC